MCCANLTSPLLTKQSGLFFSGLVSFAHELVKVNTVEGREEFT